MAAKAEGVTPELCEWQPSFLAFFSTKKEKVEEIYNDYVTRLNLT
jgi:hypothetical protein